MVRLIKKKGHGVFFPCNLRNIDAICQTAVLNALARASGSKDDHSFAQKAENTLDRLAMMHQAGVSNIKPDVFTYTAYVVYHIYKKCILPLPLC